MGKIVNLMGQTFSRLRRGQKPELALSPLTGRAYRAMIEAAREG